MEGESPLGLPAQRATWLHWEQHCSAQPSSLRHQGAPPSPLPCPHFKRAAPTFVQVMLTHVMALCLVQREQAAAWWGSVKPMHNCWPQLYHGSHSPLCLSAAGDRDVKGPGGTASSPMPLPGRGDERRAQASTSLTSSGCPDHATPGGLLTVPQQWESHLAYIHISCLVWVKMLMPPWEWCQGHLHTEGDARSVTATVKTPVVELSSTTYSLDLQK